MSNLDKRINDLEKHTGGQGTTPERDIDTDETISKLGLDPVVIRATAKANDQPVIEVVAGELGKTVKDLKEDLRRRAYGRH